MKSLWKFSPETGKERGVITWYILHSIDREPKSGYDLLKEIKEKTNGVLVPSKGTLYPILKSLESEKLIRVRNTGKRSKTIYELTEIGEDTLRTIRDRKEESRERLNLYNNLIMDVYGEETASLRSRLLNIKFAIKDLPPDKKEMAYEILDQCLVELREIAR